jgi:hypothetical protein
LQFIRRAELCAANIGDHVEATIYACRRLAPAIDVFGRSQISIIIKAAKGHLEMAKNSDADPEDIQRAAKSLQDHIDLINTT